MTGLTTSPHPEPLQNGSLDVRPRIWSLTARELHDAFWNSRGVQCVRQGSRVHVDRTAELFLLVEPHQMVLFDLDKLMNRLIWQGAAVTRIRLTNEDVDSYCERIVYDDAGFVERVERRYTPAYAGSHRVFLTSRPKLAELWSHADSPRTGWASVRRSVAWSRIDRTRAKGKWFHDTESHDDQRLINELVERWPDPDRVIEGIEQPRPGVWVPKGTRFNPDAIVVGPVWLGADNPIDADLCVVGPAWCGDSPGSRMKASIRSLFDIEQGRAGQAVAAQPKHGSSYPAAKRLFDIVFSLAALIGLSPLLLIIAVAILVDTGAPVFFGHTRQSRGGRDFRCLKFRTMRNDAEKLVADLTDQNVCDGPQVYIENDPRVTRVGRILRRFQLDELPQFWNVLKGDMSIVGPRPSPDRENRICPAWRELRLSVRPGLTGLWQLQRTRSPGEDFQEWIRYDIEYVRLASFWLDLQICFRTMIMLFRGRRENDTH